MRRFTVATRGMHFPSTVHVPRLLRFSANDLAHALFVTGRAPGDEALFGETSWWEFVHRVSLIPAYVRRTYPGDRLRRSRLAGDLDRSEKVSVSYAIGQAATSIFAMKVLGVHRLMHVDRYASSAGVTFGVTRRRPDLFGESLDGWVVAEAKGRSNAFESTLPATLRAQKRAIRSINGAAPAVSFGCVASFPPPDRYMRIDAYDPVDEALDAMDLEIDPDRFILSYYEPFLAALARGERVDDETNEIARFDGLDLELGLQRDVGTRVRAAKQGGVEGLAGDIDAILDGHTRDAGSDGDFDDGTVMRVDWPSIDQPDEYAQ